MSRRDELRSGLRRVHDQVEAACASFGRDPAEVTVVAVTKYFPASDIRLLHELGVRDVAENKHQEGAAKREECAGLDLTWHFVGQMQSNKAAAVARWADVVHSVDRPRLVAPLARGAGERNEPLAVLLQVSLDPPEQRGDRGGVSPEAAPALADDVAAHAELRLRGVMGVAPRDGDPTAAFERLRAVAVSVRETHPHATWISAGMSGDLQAAIAQGATHVRVGTAILGNRPGR